MMVLLRGAGRGNDLLSKLRRTSSTGFGASVVRQHVTAEVGWSVGLIQQPAGASVGSRQDEDYASPINHRCSLMLLPIHPSSIFSPPRPASPTAAFTVCVQNSRTNTGFMRKFCRDRLVLPACTWVASASRINVIATLSISCRFSHISLEIPFLRLGLLCA